MYTLAVKKDFIAQHFLVGGDWGPENQKHSHHYQIEIVLKGSVLDSHGFVADIVDVRQHLENLVSRYRDRTLNELPEFTGLNPSIENLAHLSYQALHAAFRKAGISAFVVKIWEDDIAWVSFDEE